jgi:hypothetical protein
MNFRAGSLGLVLCVCAAAAVPTLIARPAHAQDDAVLKMARERFKEGVRYYDQKKYEDARAAFLQAYALKKHPAVLLNLAQSELHSGHVADAANHFAQFLRENSETTPAERSDAEKGLRAAKTKVEEVNVSASQGGAEIFVDGQSVGLSPLPGPIYLAPGTHTIQAKKGSESASTSVAAMAGQATTATLSFGAGGGPATPNAGGANASSGAGTAPPTGPEESGTANGSGPVGGEGGEGASTAGREPFFTWAAHNPVAWVGGGLTVVGLAGGIGFALASHSSYNNADNVANAIVTNAAQERPPLSTRGLCNNLQSAAYTGRAGDYQRACNDYQSDTNAGDTQKTLSIVGFVVAGVAAAGTVAYYFVDSGHKKDEGQTASGVRTELVPVASPYYQGLSVIGQF